MFYSHVGTHQSKLVEIQVAPKSFQGGSTVAILLEGKMIGSLYGTELQQMLQYIVNNDGVDLEELRQGKLVHDGSVVTT